MRLLISGSRTWDDTQPIHRAIYTEVMRTRHEIGETLTVVHGAAKGVDMIAAAYTRSLHLLGAPVTEEPHPADWTGPCAPECQPGHRRKKHGRPQFYCPTAGHRRNQHMVDLGADLALVFIRNASTGATDCLNRIRSAGIEHVVIDWDARREPEPDDAQEAGDV
jgi:hypothetical protein